MNNADFKRILVANRGEIASRIVRALQSLGKKALVIYADDDRELPFVKEADEAYRLGSGALTQTYLHLERIISIAKEARADAIHPGYGFLAENARFAQSCKEGGIRFIGPSAEAISLMGNKSEARKAASELGIPVLEGETGDLDALLKKRFDITYPVLLKPAAGGGGKGMRILGSAADLEKEARAAAREALNYFGSGELYLERFLEGARHVEVQVLADHHGNMVHLFERECSLQRRYQKIVEEAPSAFISEETRSKITSAALELAGGIAYTSAGTVEFLVDRQQDFYFMEMNTRIQVEHPVTEAITGIDLVQEQIRIAEGSVLSFSQQQLKMEGHAMEIRLYAEDPLQDFLPSSGSLDCFELPAEKDVRIDKGYGTGNLVAPWYDPMLAKIIVKGKDRDEAIANMLGALKNTHITGLFTNRDFLVALLHTDAFRLNRLHTGYLDMEMKSLQSLMQARRKAFGKDIMLAAAAFIALDRQEIGETDSGSPWQQIGHWRHLPEITLLWNGETHRIRYRRHKGHEQIILRLEDRESSVRVISRRDHQYRLRIDDRVMDLWGMKDRSEIHLDVDGQRFACRRTDVPDRRHIPRNSSRKDTDPGEISAPLNGRVVEIPVKDGDRVVEGSALVVIESMKMENKILSDREAIVSQIEIKEGQQVRTNQILMTLVSL